MLKSVDIEESVQLVRRDNAEWQETLLKSKTSSLSLQVSSVHPHLHAHFASPSMDKHQSLSEASRVPFNAQNSVSGFVAPASGTHVNIKESSGTGTEPHGHNAPALTRHDKANSGIVEKNHALIRERLLDKK